MINKGNIVFENCKKKNRKKKISIGALVVTTVILGVIISGLCNEKNTSAINNEQISYGEINIPQMINQVESFLVAVEIVKKDGSVVDLSGFVYSEDGLVVASNRDMNDFDSIRVKFFDNEVVEGIKVGEDELNRIALIRVEKFNLNEFPRDKCDIKVGDAIFQITTSFEKLKSTAISEGIVSAKDKKEINEGGFAKKVTISDIIYKKDCEGSVIVNKTGKVIGVSIFNKSDVSEELDDLEMLDINELVLAVENIKSENEKTVFGIHGKNIVEGTNENVGIYIQEINKNSDADRAGLRPTDILLEINGHKVKSLEDIDDIIGKIDINGQIQCKIIRHKFVTNIILDINTKSADLTE